MTFTVPKQMSLSIEWFMCDVLKHGFYYQGISKWLLLFFLFCFVLFFLISISIFFLAFLAFTAVLSLYIRE